jgi:hypothetical protein
MIIVLIFIFDKRKYTENLVSKVTSLIINPFSFKTIKISIAVISVVLLIFYSSFAFNAHAQRGGSATSGAAMGGAATGPGAQGGSATSGPAIGGSASGPNAAGGSATSGPATGGSAIGGNSTSNNTSVQHKSPF